ncbi:esterase-like activity of phytase family protein [Xanthocytophaga flava]|uniref:esterase-like activity of phytase family protein n=1 Tax=Xanthocytophaga flava TaxID=3048013 RepID=UPI0028D8167C|nr:esterase-like activity of phytase family protein [Xanthocytophaga flavus]MDJ1468407.1 esterase-like activity of phytase family protein [Xanthocytophaga flavus]
MKHKLPGLSIASLFLLLLSCQSDNPAPFTYPDSALQASPKILATNTAGVKVYNGGFGSGLAVVPNSTGSFYLLTDRGPNVDGTLKDSKIFAKPDFTPLIGKFTLKNDSLVLESTIELKTSTGVKLTGLPNPPGYGATGEGAYDTNGNLLDNDIEGIDSEGLVAAADGTFWISDEYGPHITHFSQNGQTIERINPFGTGTGGRKLPAVFATRRANRGMEGLAITPDNKTLVGIMQSTMYNPSSAAIVNKKLTRIVFFDIATAATKQYVYLQDANGLSNCDIVAITNTTFLVLERDGDFPQDSKSPAVYKRVYKIDVSSATDVSDATNGANGKLYGGKTLEQLTDAELQSNSITPVTKTLVVDLLQAIPGYPHDKPEGLTIIDNNMIAVANDDDFGILNDTNTPNNYMAKVLPATNKTDRGTIYFIKLSTSLK